ncbi:hypothetical protein DM02DRAFT_591635 [Periconia macrospinosa]|uniref:F-box domain-containing protein n=1 Tax=Periconia macrospinosa TaxID=97972 RepID=A0A2V1DW96_9PLEO|nr:hypothetical protein DM02DRAFT_591635 [Periconia macrospinosa]
MSDKLLDKAQLESLTYAQIRIKDFTLDDNLPVYSPVDGSIRKPPGFDLGALDALPLEILQELLSFLDLRTLVDFLRVNRRALQVVESIPQYEAITTHARDALRAILSIETGQWISCNTLYEKLCTAECEECGDFAGYLYILTCKRVCFLCLSENRKYLPLLRSHADRKFGLPSQILRTLPCMKSVPGRYSPGLKKCHNRLVLVDYDSAYHEGVMLYGSASAMEKHVSNVSAQKLEEFNKRVTEEKARGSHALLRRPKTSDAFDRKSENPLRFMAIVRIPWLNKSSRELDWGKGRNNLQTFDQLMFDGVSRRVAHYTTPNIQLLQASADPDDASEFRILVDDKSIKYITIDAGVYEVDDMCFGPSLVSILPSLPSGKWNTGYITRHPTDGSPYFASVAEVKFPGIKNPWCEVQIDYLELRMGEKLRSNVYEATHPQFDSTIVVKFARFDWEIPQLDAETSAYQWIEGHGIGPKFLGHVSEDGRVIGFIMEKISDCRHATPEDLSICQAALSRLHNLGIKHGDTNKHNFLIHDGKAILIDFDCSTQNNDAGILDEEFRGLEGQLCDGSGRGGVVMLENDAA